MSHYTSEIKTCAYNKYRTIFQLWVLGEVDRQTETKQTSKNETRKRFSFLQQFPIWGAGQAANKPQNESIQFYIERCYRGIHAQPTYYVLQRPQHPQLPGAPTPVSFLSIFQITFSASFKFPRRSKPAKFLVVLTLVYFCNFHNYKSQT